MNNPKPASNPPSSWPPPPSTPSSSTVDPDQYINQLTHIVKSNEASLAALVSHSKQAQHQHPTQQPSQNSWISLNTLTHGLNLLNPINPFSTPLNSTSASASSPSTLRLDPHHLYYLLLKFDQLALQSVPLDINLNDPSSHLSRSSKSPIKSYDPTNWMIGFDPTHPLINKPSSFPKDKSDTSSLFSNLSIRSNPWFSNQSHPSVYGLPNPSSLIFSLLPTRPTHPPNSHPSSIQDQVKYLYSTFTKLPSLCLTPSSNPLNSVINHHPSTNPILSSSSVIDPMQLLEGFTDLPNQNAIPLSCFKSIWSLYLQNLDPRLFIGWDRISQNLRSLEIRRSGLEDVESFLIDTIMDDIQREKRKKLIEIHLADERSDQNNPDHLHLHHPPSDSSSSIEPSSHSSHSSSSSNSNSNSLPVGFPTLAWAFLQHLCLADNSLTFLPSAPLTALKSLSSLDLSSNLLIAVPSGLKDLPRLKLLNLSNNMIESVLGIYLSLNSVTSINLSRNRLSSLCGLERLSTLERLDIRSNQVYDISELSRLAILPSLTSLWTSENPFCGNRTHHQSDWRIEIFNYFSSENREIDFRSDLLINLKLENLAPTYSERKLIKKPLGRLTTPEPSILTDQSRKTFVKSPEKKINHHHRPKKLEESNDHPSQSDCLPNNLLDPSSFSSSIVMDRSLPSSSNTVTTVNSKRVVSFKKKDKPHRKKVARIVELQNSQSSKLPEFSSSTGLNSPDESGQTDLTVNDTADHHQLPSSVASLSMGSSGSSASSSSQLLIDRVKSPTTIHSFNLPPIRAKLLQSTSTTLHYNKQSNHEDGSPLSTSSLDTPDQPPNQPTHQDSNLLISSSSTQPLRPNSRHQTLSYPLPHSNPDPSHQKPHQNPIAHPDRSISDNHGFKLRQKIAALKVEVGEDAWLKVLGETDFGSN